MENLQKKADEERINRDIEERKMWMAEAISKTRIPKRFIGASLEQFNPGTNKLVEEFINGESQGLFIYGTRGTGKTHLAAAIIKKILKNASEHVKYHDLIPRASFVTIPGLLVDIRSTFNSKGGDTEEDVISWASSRDFLIMDDMGAEKTTDWSMSTLYVIIDKRYSEMMPTIITSNMTVAEVAERVGDRIASRIAGMCKVIELKGKDRRLNK